MYLHLSMIHLKKQVFAEVLNIPDPFETVSRHYKSHLFVQTFYEQLIFTKLDTLTNCCET